jgi:hypothetical protein
MEGGVMEIVKHWIDLEEHRDEWAGECPFCDSPTLVVDAEIEKYHCCACSAEGEIDPDNDVVIVDHRVGEATVVLIRLEPSVECDPSAPNEPDPACRRCVFSDKEASSLSGETWLVCRRHAPGPIDAWRIRQEWPRVNEDDWCGDFCTPLEWEGGE